MLIERPQYGYTDPIEKTGGFIHDRRRYDKTAAGM